MDSVNSSIYIPRISISHTMESIKEVMKAKYLGTVVRVDFTPVNKKPGFVENVDDNFVSAFVHFSNPVLSIDGRYHYDTRDNYCNYLFWNRINNGESCKIWVSSTEYWICLKNKNPVKQTLMNVHQIVENARFLEILVKSQVLKIEELERKIEDLSSIIHGSKSEK